MPLDLKVFHFRVMHLRIQLLLLTKEQHYCSSVQSTDVLQTLIILPWQESFGRALSPKQSTPPINFQDS